MHNASDTHRHHGHEVLYHECLPFTLHRHTQFGRGSVFHQGLAAAQLRHHHQHDQTQVLYTRRQPTHA